MEAGKTARRLYGELASAVGSSRKQAGSWFVAFTQSVVRDYAEEVLELGGARNWRERWPGLSEEEIADRIVRQAVRQSALAGAATGVTSTAAYVASFGAPFGLAALPAAVSTLGAEILYTTRVQLRLVYDLATLYGYPIDPADPEDLYRAFALANGVKVSVGDLDEEQAFSLDAVRAHLRALLEKRAGEQTRLALNVLGPQIGRQIVMRALVRAGVPFVGVGASAAWNLYSTANIGAVARQELRALAQLRSAAVEMGQAIGGDPATLAVAVEAATCVATADGRFGMREREIVDTVVRAVKEESARPRGLEDARLDPEDVRERLARVPDARSREAVAACVGLVAACDGQVSYAETGLLTSFCEALGQPFELDALKAKALDFRRDPTPADRVRRWFVDRWERLPALRRAEA
ncbi:MAG: hypothetical protein ACOZNI_20615 [Myxococcota bacterium]